MNWIAEHKQQRKRDEKIATTQMRLVDALSPNTSKRPQASQKGSKRGKESAPVKSRKKRATVETDSSGSKDASLEADSKFTHSQHGHPPAGHARKAASPSSSLQSRSIDSTSFHEIPSTTHGGGAAGRDSELARPYCR